MSGSFIAFLLLGAAAGGFINGLSGTGTALFALGFYLVVLDPVQAVAIVALMSVLAGLQGLWIVRRDILAKPKRLLRFLLPGLAGVPFGLSLLNVIDAGTLRLGIATLLIVYGGYFGFRAALPAFTRRTPVVDCGIGFVGGVLGGAASVSGAIPAMWLSIRPWTKSATRAVLQPFNVAILSTTVCLLFFKGAFDRTAMQALLITIPTGMVAAQVGIAVFRMLSDTAFRRLLIILTLLMGVGIMVSELT
ncbi:sulfite exporter TauE/SafE family protein [uncultured Tateyamaria sp.]|uniref:sulfite exporter TauE/SafE family protein n=1 Tax=uncultured Tateyamaria sp. TaxID=455651 RepID=UPI0026348F25|nr:sulfite exporter TauE/SafE family protein [uncultured Tateyamaria sp.]